MDITRTLRTLGGDDTPHACPFPDPDDAFMFYALAKDLIDPRGYALNTFCRISRRSTSATRGELDISAIAFTPTLCERSVRPVTQRGDMGDGYGPMLVAKEHYSKEEIAGKKIAVPGEMTSAFLALQLWLGGENGA